jgi:sterol desaturase/sphingolipid hydroxylase (fatty acid hydroxylase superfamily)
VTDLYLDSFLTAVRDYFIFCGVAYVVFHLVLRRWLARRKITQRPTGLRAPLQEIGRALVSNLLGRAPFLVALGYLIYLGVIPKRMIYTDVAERGWLYFAGTIVFSVLLFDLWFYLSHRFLLHSKLGYRYIHIVHHYSVDPTPFARNAVHPVESILNGVFHVLPVFIMPHHPLAILIATHIKGTVGIMGHLGYEYLWSGFTRHWLTRYLVTPVHHHLHHAKNVRTNFSFLINYDLIFGTQNRYYHDVFEATVHRARAAPEVLAPLSAHVGPKGPRPKPPEEDEPLDQAAAARSAAAGA